MKWILSQDTKEFLKLWFMIGFLLGVIIGIQYYQYQYDTKNNDQPREFSYV